MSLIFWKCEQYQGYLSHQNSIGGTVIVIYLFLKKIDKWYYFLAIGHEGWNVIRWMIAFTSTCIQLFTAIIKLYFCEFQVLNFG